jgi:phage gp45-like
MWWKRNLWTMLVRMHITTAIMVPQKIKNRATNLLNSSTIVYISKGNKISMSNRHLNSYVDCSIIHNCQEMKATEDFIKQTKTTCYIYTVEHHSDIKKY